MCCSSNSRGGVVGAPSMIVTVRSRKLTNYKQVNNNMTKSSSLAPRRAKSGGQYVTKKAVRDMLNAQVERKIAIGTSSQTASTAGAMTYFSSIAQDDTISGRTGDKIMLKQVDWTFSYSDNITSVCRLMLVLDRFNQGVAPSVTDVLSSATVQAHMQAVNKLQNRFTVLVDVVMDVALGARQYITKRGTVKLNTPVYFNGTAASVGSAGRNGMFLLMVGGQATGGIAVNVSQTYTDM